MTCDPCAATTPGLHNGTIKCIFSSLCTSHTLSMQWSGDRIAAGLQGLTAAIYKFNNLVDL